MTTNKTADHQKLISELTDFLNTASTDELVVLDTVRKRLLNDFDNASGFDMKAFEAHAAVNQWKTRRERGYQWKADVFGFIEDTYGEWAKKSKEAGRVITQADIKRVDLSLYNKLSQTLWAIGAPENFCIPAQKDAALMGLDEHEKERRLGARSLWRDANSFRRRGQSLDA